MSTCEDNTTPGVVGQVCAAFARFLAVMLMMIKISPKTTKTP
jgi:hypothetical protein